MKKSTASMLSTLVLCLGLASCAAPLLVGGVLGSAMVATDRRTAGVQLEDEGIELRGASAIRENFGSKEYINITSYNRQVLITGAVTSETVRTQAAQLIGRVRDVRTVVNELVVGPVPTASERASNALLVAKVKAAMVDSEDVFANMFKVVGENGTIYLMGLVTRPEAARATDVVRSVSGVKRVVRVLEYLSDDELRALQPSKRSNEDAQSVDSPRQVAPIVTPIK